MRHIRIIELPDDPFIDRLIEHLAKDFHAFPGGYPSYLDHIARTVSTIEKEVPVRADHITSYKTLQRIIEKSNRPQLGTTRFLYVYLQLVNPDAAASCENRRSPFSRGEELLLEEYRDFKGRSDNVYPSYGLDAFVHPARVGDGAVFGVEAVRD